MFRLCYFARDYPNPKSTKGHHHAKKAEEQEGTDSRGIEMFVATVKLKVDVLSGDWIIDSGASQRSVLETPEPVELGDGCTVTTLGAGKVKIASQLHCGEKFVGWMTDVLYVPKLNN